ncbi:hypothetical protein NP569_26690, partial [Vibrio parahaemolyticus]|nr:hypothetical protein [Vibrio parahaemolyticus]
ESNTLKVIHKPWEDYLTPTLTNLISEQKEITTLYDTQVTIEKYYKIKKINKKNHFKLKFKGT